MIPIEVEKLKGTLTRLILTEMAFQLEDEILKSKPQLLNGKEQEGETPKWLPSLPTGVLNPKESFNCD